MLIMAITLLLATVVLTLFFGTTQAYEFAGVIYDPGPASKVPGTVPLTAVSIRLDVRGLTVGILAELKYENSVGEMLESTFVFPLSDEAAVYRLEATIGDRHLVGKVERRETAEEMYQEAVSAGKKAVLLRNQKGVADVFRLSLGNLPAFGTAIITIGYVQPIDKIYEDALLSITLPMVLNPRYLPHHELINPEVMKAKFSEDEPYIAVSDNTYNMKFSATVNLGLNRRIYNVTCRHESDKLEVKMSDDQNTAEVTLLNDFTGDHDFQLNIAPFEPFEPMIYLEPRVKQYDNIWLIHDILAAWVFPRKDSGEMIDPTNFEFWLVVDRSGSMAGEKIAGAKSALSILISRLPPGCKFNIVGFGTEFKALFPHVAIYEGDTAANAIKHLQSIEADLGGTEILEPLKFIYSEEKAVDNNERFILLLTDGEVSNTDEVIKLAQRNADTTRVFAIGIGEGASMALVNGVARVSGGVSAFVRGKNDRLQTKVLDMLSAMIRPRLANASLEWIMSAGGRIGSLIPPDLPPVYSDTALFQYAVIERFRGQRVTGSAYFTADSITNCDGGCRLHFHLENDVDSKPTDTLPLHRLAAKKMLISLTDRYKDSNQDVDREEAIAISMSTGVLCEFTAMVAVDSETDEPVKPTTHSVDKIVREEKMSMTNNYIGQTYHQTSTAISQHYFCLTFSRHFNNNTIFSQSLILTVLALITHSVFC